MDIIQNNNLRRSVLRMEEKRNILKNFVDKMEKLFGKSLKKLILYGSYARGDYKENSDIDIMILTSMSDDEIRDIENQVYDIAYDYQLSDNVMISVNIKNADHYNYWLGALPYYDNVEKDGVVLVGYGKLYRWHRNVLKEIIIKMLLIDLIMQHFML